MICKIIALFLNTLTTDKYSLLNRDNLSQPILMQLSKKQKFLSIVFCNAWNLDQIFNILKKRWPAYVFSELYIFVIISQLMYFWNYRLRKTWLEECLKSPTSEDPSTRNFVNGLRHCSNLHDSTFIIFIDHCEEHSVREIFS